MLHRCYKIYQVIAPIHLYRRCLNILTFMVKFNRSTFYTAEIGIYVILYLSTSSSVSIKSSVRN